MKKIAIFAAAFAFILLLTKIANNVPPPPPSGTAFSLKAQQVIQCSPEEITLVDNHEKSTHLEKDESWPDCSVFQKDDILDFYLSRGDKTKLLSYEKSAWWRKAMYLAMQSRGRPGQSGLATLGNFCTIRSNNPMAWGGPFSGPNWLRFEPERAVLRIKGEKGNSLKIP